MPQSISTMCCAAVTLAALTLAAPAPLETAGRRTKVVLRRHTVVIAPNHPIRRSVSRTVVVRPACTRVVVSAPRVFLPVVTFTAVAVALPARDRLVWQDSEVIRRSEDWVDVNFGAGQRGDALMLAVEGRARLDFAEVEFDNGNLQVVDFNERAYASGIFPLLNFADGRRVMNVRLLAKSETARTTFTVYLKR